MWSRLIRAPYGVLDRNFRPFLQSSWRCMVRPSVVAPSVATMTHLDFLPLVILAVVGLIQ